MSPYTASTTFFSQDVPDLISDSGSSSGSVAMSDKDSQNLSIASFLRDLEEISLGHFPNYKGPQEYRLALHNIVINAVREETWTSLLMERYLADRTNEILDNINCGGDNAATSRARGSR